MTDMKSEVTQTRQDAEEFRNENVKAPVLNWLTSESDINLSQEKTHRDLPRWKVINDKYTLNNN